MIKNSLRFLFKKIKGKFHWDFDPKVSLENYLSDVIQVFFGKLIFLSVNPKHSSKHTILNIHLNMHILAMYLK